MKTTWWEPQLLCLFNISVNWALDVSDTVHVDTHLRWESSTKMRPLSLNAWAIYWITSDWWMECSGFQRFLFFHFYFRASLFLLGGHFVWWFGGGQGLLSRARCWLVSHTSGDFNNMYRHEILSQALKGAHVFTDFEVAAIGAFDDAFDLIY